MGWVEVWVGWNNGLGGSMGWVELWVGWNYGWVEFWLGRGDFVEEGVGLKRVRWS